MSATPNAQRPSQGSGSGARPDAPANASTGLSAAPGADSGPVAETRGPRAAGQEEPQSRETLDSASLTTPCPWCNAAPGRPCVTRAAHPVTGRAVTTPTATHPERTRAATTESR